MVQILDNSQNRNSSRTQRRSLRYSSPYIIEYSIPGIDRNTVDFDNLLNTFMQPVEVYPTQTQIEAATRLVQYCNISRPINTQCPISMDEFNDTDMVTVIRHCGHIFNTDELMNWFSCNCRCPVCRYDIREDSSNSSTNFFRTASTNTSSNPSSNRNEINDIVNNNVERTNINSGMNNLFRNIDIFSDLSGNNVDSIALMLLNAINRTRNR
jgi:hypothetical protein